MYGICNLSIIPVRKDPSESAEMCTQLLFGEAYQVIEISEKWMKIATCDCGYEGWVTENMWNPIHELDIESYLKSKKYILKELLLFVKEFETNITFPIFIGSSFPIPKNNMLILGESIFVIQLPKKQKSKSNSLLSAKQYELLRFASSYLEAPYLWGGRTPAGIDCSGLVQIAFKSIGIDLPRDASQQVKFGENVDFITEANVGNVAFFQNEEGKVIHTGIMAGNGMILHASGKVRIDPVDSTGIFNKKSEQYTHYLRVIKRLIS